MAADLLSEALARGCCRIKKVAGPGGLNNVVLKMNSSPPPPNKCLVYFGGDVQNLERVMLDHQEYQQFAKWSLEAVVDRLFGAHPDSVVLAVQPSAFEYFTFACYHNFVESDSTGAPKKHGQTVGDGRAVAQLRGLLSDLDQRLPDLQLERLPKKVIGFSKGVVVLNQLLLDAAAKQHEEFFETIETMCWLDGGHNGGKNTWITNKESLANFVKNVNCNVDIRLTPYQIKDVRRPWIGQEEKIFSDTLTHLMKHHDSTKKLRRNVYFQDEPASLEAHFQVLDTFTDLPLHLL